jgi:transposase InsO family protein
MSRKGNCWDNAVAESVNGKFKTELLYRQEVFETKEAARDAIIEYIEGYYNYKRRHQTLNYRRPNEVWNEYFAKGLTDKKCRVQ